MAASRNDQFVLGTNQSFINRVRASLESACVAISNESNAGLAFALYTARHKLANTIVFAPNNWDTLFAQTVATDANVIADATVGGSVVLSSANIATQQALVTDAHIDNAVSGQFNTYATSNL